MKKRWLVLLFLTIAALLTPPSALAHKESDAYVNLRTDPHDDHRMHGQWDIALRELDYAIGLDTHHDGAITWGEVQARRAAIEAYAMPKLQIKGDGLTVQRSRLRRKSTNTRTVPTS